MHMGTSTYFYTSPLLILHKSFYSLEIIIKECGFQDKEDLGDPLKTFVQFGVHDTTITPAVLLIWGMSTVMVKTPQKWHSYRFETRLMSAGCLSNISFIARNTATVTDRILSKVKSCWIYGGQSCTEAGYLRILRFPLPVLLPPAAPHSLIILSSTLYSLDTVSVVK
jgi:hypothetical protein